MNALLTPAIVEKAARAIQSYAQKGSDDAWDAIHASAKEYWLDVARAALLAALPDIGEALARVADESGNPKNRTANKDWDTAWDTSAQHLAARIRALTQAKPSLDEIEDAKHGMADQLDKIADELELAPQ